MSCPFSCCVIVFKNNHSITATDVQSILKTKTGNSVDVENFDNEVKEYAFGGDEDQRFTDLYKGNKSY